jgi:hypothetical protein
MARTYSRPNVDITLTEVLVVIGGIVVIGWGISLLFGAARAA